MIITAPVTDYIPASILTTLNDLVVRGAAIPARQPGLLRAIGTYVGYATRNAGGTVTHAVMGFSPSLVVLLAVDDTGGNLNWSIGFINEVQTDRAIYQSANGTTIATTSLPLYVRRDVNNRISASSTSIDADGFTLEFSLTGVCACNYLYICFP